MEKLIDFDKSLTVIYHSDNLWIFIILVYGVREKKTEKRGNKNQKQSIFINDCTVIEQKRMNPTSTK